MLKSLIKFGLSAAVLAGAAFLSDGIQQNLSRQSTLQFYETQKYQSDRDIQFSPGGLQAYTVEAGRQATQASQLPSTSVWLVAAGLVGIVFSPGSSSTLDRGETLYRQWRKASRENNSLDMARIEIEMQKVEDGHRS